MLISYGCDMYERVVREGLRSGAARPAMPDGAECDIQHKCFALY